VITKLGKASIRRDSKGQLRDYGRENRLYNSKPDQVKNRVLRNKARRELGLKVGDPREADHVRPLSRGGSGSKGNLRVISRGANRRKFVS